MTPLLLVLVASSAHHPWLPGDEPGSVSVGSPQSGHLVGGVRLPHDSPRMRQLPTQAARGLDWGTEALVDTLARAAKAVNDAYPGSVTHLGNLSRRGGGDIPWSASHNSGRDADIAFHLLDPSGAPTQRTDLVTLDDAGWAFDAEGALRFDVERNWVLVRALLTDPNSTPQYVFVSDPLRRLLLTEAERRDEPRAIIAQARRVLRQPRGKPPHDDHLHLRIHCARRDLTHGCRDTGPQRDGAARPDRVRPKRIALARGLLLSPVVDVRRRAVALLGLMAEASVAPRLVEMLKDPAPAVRSEVAKALVALAATQGAPALATALAEQGPPQTTYDLAWAYVELAPARAAEALTPLLARSDTLPTGAALRGEVARLIASASAVEATPGVVDLLVDPDEGVRNAAREALSRLANTDLGPDMPAWRRWWKDAQAAPRRTWVARGLRAGGYQVADDAGREAAKTLVEAVGDETSYMSENARRWLMDLYGVRDRTNLMWGRDDAAWFWRVRTSR